VASELAWQQAEQEAVKQATDLARKGVAATRSKSPGGTPTWVRVSNIDLEVQVTE
jgi:hypothetical protein